MENHSYGEIIGSSDAPYLNSLAHKCGLAANFSAESHPSLPNYVAMTSGSTQGIKDDGDPSEHPLAVQSIFSQLGGGWRALDESMPSACDLNDALLVRRPPQPGRVLHEHPRSCARQDTPLTARPNLSARFTFITPNLCHDMHDCSASQGDSWLAGFLPKILGSREYRKQSTAVFITWDEGSGDNHIATLVLSRYTRPHTVSSKSFNHYSLLRTTEALLGITASSVRLRQRRTCARRSTCAELRLLRRNAGGDDEAAQSGVAVVLLGRLRGDGPGRDRVGRRPRRGHRARCTSARRLVRETPAAPGR